MRLFCILIALFFISCSKNDIVIADIKAQTLIYTQKTKFSYGSFNYILSLSFLNPVLDEYNKNDVFALFIAPSFDVSNLQVFIDDEKVSLEPIENDDILLKFLIQNEYAKHYKINATKKDTDPIIAKICSNIFTCFELSFQRYSKSLYYRSEEDDIQHNLQEPF
ncbi:hypothetical protein [uncultured Campylobacter sp.]|uniref:hypothetical protein n=1 Tax=uncultured Campylobacter sp. TaxID=218934 RepID=UPI00260810D1|nr:hypothetical protein [uncultured Campylobacter sp.]